jgi:uncharacterized protein
MRHIAWVFFCLFTLVAQVDAASFDCSKAVTKVEKLICTNEEISKLDEALSESYKKSLRRADIKQKAIDSQRQWLKNVRNPCDAVDCIKSAYETRIKEIELMSSFGIVILSAPPGKRGVTPLPLSIPVASVKQDTVSTGQPAVVQTCDKSSMPDVGKMNTEKGVLLLIETFKEKMGARQFECAVQAIEQAHGLIQSTPDGVKRAAWGFELKDVAHLAIRSNVLPDDAYEYRLIRASTQSLNDDWSPDMKASEDERLNDTAFLGWVSDHYAKKADDRSIENSWLAAHKRVYPVRLAMMRMDFTIPANRRWVEPWRIESFFNVMGNGRDYLGDLYQLWSGLSEEDRQKYQKEMLSGVLRETAGHVNSGYNLLATEEAKRNIEILKQLLVNTPQASVGWQTDMYFAEAYWQSGDKKSAHDYFESARHKQAPYISKGYVLFSMARYLCTRMENGKFLQLCPYGIYSREEMLALLNELDGMAETDSSVKNNIEKIRSMRNRLTEGAAQ